MANGPAALRTTFYILFAALSLVVLGLSAKMHQRARHYCVNHTAYPGDDEVYAYSDGFRGSTDAVLAWSVISFIYYVVALFASISRTTSLASPLIDSFFLSALFVFGLGSMGATTHYGPGSYPDVGKGMLGLGWILVWVGFVWLVLDLFYIFNNLGRANRNWRDDVSPDHISRFQSQDGSQEFTKDPYTGGAGGAPAAPNPIAGLTPAAQFAYPHQAPQVNYTGSPNLPNIPATIPERQQQWFEHDKHQGGDISEKA